jgi:hypothetical protein
MMMRLWTTLLKRDATDQLLADGALIALVAHLLQRADVGTEPGSRVAMPAGRSFARQCRS